jgi:myosin-18
MFPQTSAKINYSDEHESKEDAPVVFDAGMSFVMGVKNQAVRQQFKPKAAHLQSSTASSALSSKIRDFLRKTDHVMEEWKRLGKKDTDMQSLATLPDRNGEDSYIGRSRSATNILIKGFQLYSRTNSASIRSPSVTRASEGDTVSEVDEVNYFAQC